MLVSAVHLSRTTQSNQRQGLQTYEQISDYLRRREVDGDVVMAEEERQAKINTVVTENNNKTLLGLIAPQKEGQCSFQCNGCEKPLIPEKDDADICICKGCNKIYCLDCDIFIHETLLSCPTCI